MNPQLHGVQRIVSGGQTGVDRAALDAAIELGIPHGGWCPLGRLAEDGKIPSQYLLEELGSRDYAARTKQNVLDSDGTLIFYRERLSGGTLLTHRIAKSQGRPLLRIRIDRKVNFQRIVDWLQEAEVRILNVAGPRGSSHPDLEADTQRVLRQLFQHQSLLSSAEPESPAEPIDAKDLESR